MLRPCPAESAGAKLSATERFTLALPERFFYDRPMIRQAVASDAVKAVPLIVQATGHITFVLTGTTDSKEAASILTDFFGQEDNRISYQNALVTEEEGEVVGVAIFYDGAKARELDAPLERAAAKKSGDSKYSIPTEPEASEFYMDALSVSPRRQRKGYGRKLIEAGCVRARKLGHHRIALLIEVDNAAAKPLYERLGFCTDYTKRIAGQEYFHMVYGVCDVPRRPSCASKREEFPGAGHYLKRRTESTKRFF